MQYYTIARIVNTFGIKGQLRILMDTDFIEERFAEGNQLYITNKNKKVAEVIVKSIQANKGAYLLELEGYDNINLVEEFKGLTLSITAQDQQELEEDSYYQHQIIGLKVYTEEEEFLGSVKEILQLGSNDVWVVKQQGNKKKDLLLPYIDDVVKGVDLEAGRVTVELLEGLMDES